MLIFMNTQDKCNKVMSDLCARLRLEPGQRWILTATDVTGGVLGKMLLLLLYSSLICMDYCGPSV